jgi:putative FmdB family regulatory protein
MPTYEYRCNACGHELEAFQKITEDALRECPECGKPALERLISGGNFVLKGQGWYKDGYNPDPKKPARTENQRADRLQKAVDEDKKKPEKKVEAA